MSLLSNICSYYCLGIVDREGGSELVVEHIMISDFLLYPANRNVAGYYVIPSEPFESLSVRQRFVSGL